MFRIASLSKMFVALSILKLQEEGKLTLEDEVKIIVPEVKFENKKTIKVLSCIKYYLNFLNTLMV